MSNSTPAPIGCTCASWKPGLSSAPSSSHEPGVLPDEFAGLGFGDDRGDAIAGDRHDVAVDGLAGSGEHGCSGEQ